MAHLLGSIFFLLNSKNITEKVTSCSKKTPKSKVGDEL